MAIDEPEALDAAEAYEAAKRLLEAAKTGESAARARLLDFTDDGNATIGPVKLTKYTITGTDYKAAAVQSGIDLDKFKKPIKVAWRLTIKMD